MSKPEVEHLSLRGRQSGIAQARDPIPIGRDGCLNRNASQRAEVEGVEVTMAEKGFGTRVELRAADIGTGSGALTLALYVTALCAPVWRRPIVAALLVVPSTTPL